MLLFRWSKQKNMSDSLISKAADSLKQHCTNAGIDETHGIKHALAVLKHTENAIDATTFNLSESRKLSIRSFTT